MFKFSIKILPFIILFLPSQFWGQWNQVKSNLPEWSSGIAIDAVDENTAVICVTGTIDDSKIFLTNNAGNSWQAIDIIDKVFPVDVSITDNNKFWVVTADGEIYFTENSGSDWILQYSNNVQAEVINYIEMFDSLNGVAMGDGVANNPNDKIAHAIVLKTNNGGKTWRANVDTLLKGHSGDSWRRIDFVDTTAGFFFASGIDPLQLFRTDNSGNNWSSTNFSNYASVLNFYDNKYGLLANQNGGIFRTVNGGDNWTEILLEAGWGNDIEFLPGDASKVWFASKQLFFSSDSGKTWNERIIENGNVYIRDIVFTDEKNGWILSDSLIYNTTNNGGEVVSVQTENRLPDRFELKQNYPNPFNPSTVITYVVPVDALNGNRITRVQLSIYNILGKKIQTLVDEYKSAGSYSINYNASNLPSGIYIYVLESGKNKIAKKMTLLK